MTTNNIKRIFGENTYNDIVKLYKDTKVGQEFEFIFSNIEDRYITQEKYIQLLKYLQTRKRISKLNSIGPIDILDINYSTSKESSYRVTIEENKNINSFLKKLDLWKSHVIFKTLVDLSKTNSEIKTMKKIKGKENTIDALDINMRVRLSDENKLEKEDYKLISDLTFEELNSIIFRLKQRFSLFVYETENEFVRIDITMTKTTRDYKNLNDIYPEFELEIEYGRNKMGSQLDLNEIFNEVMILHKIIQQSNHVITNSKTTEVLKFYRELTSTPETLPFLNARQPISLEIQYLVDKVPNRYAITDKADGDRYFMIIMNKHCYFISTNLVVKDSGIDLKDDKCNGTLFDGEYIFIPKLNRHIYMIFDAIFISSKDLRKESKFFNRLSEAENFVKKYFVADKQIGYNRREYTAIGEYNLDAHVKFCADEILKSMKALNNDMQFEKMYPLIRVKYFIGTTGVYPWDIFRFADTMWSKYTNDITVNCPYVLDGLIFQPLEQQYVTDQKDTKLFEYKWKPPKKNSIDFYIQFEKDKLTGKVLTVYDNSNDEYAKNKPYRICRLYNGKRMGPKETPVLFNEEEEIYWAYLFLENGEVRDEDGNIVTDGTVVEFYYNNEGGEDVFIPEKFRWKVIKTRYDKTESVLRYERKFGNAYDVALRIWRSIVNPILIEDFRDLGKGNNPDKNQYFYDKKMEILQKKIGHELIVAASKQNAYYQKITNLAATMRQYHNWIKSNIIYTYCNKVYRNNKQSSVLDMGIGRGGDISKYYYSEVAFCVGIDISKEGLTSPVDSATSRYEKQRRGKPNFPKMYFIHADGGTKLNYEDQYKALGGMNQDNKNLMEKFFSSDPKLQTKFDIISCQHVMHYFLKDEQTWKNFKDNINQTLRNGGYFMITHFDARRVIQLLSDKQSVSYDYTDEKGDKQKLFEIVKKFDVDTKKHIGVGNAIDLFAAWMFEDGTYQTEYLVDLEFIKKDLLEYCNLEIIETDLYENQYNLNKIFFTENYYMGQPNEKTREFFKNVSEYYTKSEINDICKIYTFLHRFTVFRKKDSNQKGGTKFNISDKTTYFIPRMDKYETNDYSLFNSIHNVLQEHGIIPKSVSDSKLYKDLNINILKDKDIDKNNINKILKKIIIQNELEKNDKIITKKVIDGLNLYVVECGNSIDEFKLNVINGSDKKNSKTIVLMKEKDLYKPIYVTVNNKRQSLFKNDDVNLKDLFI
jgi:hypothetical protein